ncbi:hypothetical protein Hanom_Chr04g00361811 [Helianthus anomalus]
MFFNHCKFCHSFQVHINITNYICVCVYDVSTCIMECDAVTFEVLNFLMIC